jgi:hypothetical protein
VERLWIGGGQLWNTVRPPPIVCCWQAAGGPTEAFLWVCGFSEDLCHKTNPPTHNNV